MNTIKERKPEESLHGQEVTVVISGCDTGDARMVFDALRAAFTTDRASVDVPRKLAERRPTAWVATVDVTEERVISGPLALGAPVKIDVQGGYWAVERLRRSLAHAFDVRVVGTVSGDQEEEVRLRLESHLSHRSNGSR
ncbi:hypothetical protein [Streptomyces sp. NBC_01618]|uniref:hypothetical protein n=1 Tax=Streptomyces sp. NBC_01618 TaxID=2975900 RepID=UPI00386FAEBE|nr:hypothetical protein OH735_01850 [Streptomyces sp. NBC_01618]